MKLKVITPEKAVTDAYLLEGLSRQEIQLFTKNLKTLIKDIDLKESEENIKNDFSRFLSNTFFNNGYDVNTRFNTDLVIYRSLPSGDKIPAVLIEVKHPKNNLEIISETNLNKKSLHQLILYYLEERVTNNQVKHLVITNVLESFIFDVNQFDKIIYRNTKISNLFDTYQNQKKDKPYFYEEISKIIPNIDAELVAAKVSLSEIEKFLESDKDEELEQLIPYYKIFSPTHLLKQELDNDSNSLNRPFYNELLYILGLEEVQKQTTSYISRVNKDDREEGALIENIITKLKAHRVIEELDDDNIEGENEEEKLFNIALELAITWINRILFLKLLESQLLAYHDNNTTYAFLSNQRVTEFDHLDTLFFEVLALKQEQRSESVKKAFPNIPYLNSSLFEPTALEKKTAFISDLKDSLKLPFFKYTVLKDRFGQKLKNDTKNTLEYLLEFLSAYDFGVEGKVKIRETNKPIINASVLGRIFEKINGYKEGSYFTPGFITEYMSRESLKRLLLQKFSEYLNKDFKSFDGLANYIKSNIYEPSDIKGANSVINEIHICDPAVGSGHFLVSTLNELIAIKSELGLLSDKNGNLLSDYNAKVLNDELIIYDRNEKPLKYLIQDDGEPNPVAQKIQATIFHEKEVLIENCLFGVDINENSVKICRLRLWIELLKNAYYTKSSNFKELKTLPNIDINIKRGNSLIHRFRLDNTKSGIAPILKNRIADLTDDYKKHVTSYKTASEKDSKRTAEKSLKKIKDDFYSIDDPFDPDYKNWKEAESLLFDERQKQLLGSNKKTEKRLSELEEKVQDLKITYKNKLKNLYGEALEWRFEFPEILTKNGNFKGFDLIIGNPPYIGEKDHSNLFKFYKKLPKWEAILSKRTNIYYAFLVQVNSLLAEDGYCSLIIPNELLTSDYAKHVRHSLANNHKIFKIIDFNENKVFKGVGTNAMVIDFGNIPFTGKSEYIKYENGNSSDDILELNSETNKIDQSYFKENDYWRFTELSGVPKNKLATIEHYGLTTQQGIITGANAAQGKLFNKIIEIYPELEYLNGRGIYVLTEEDDIKFNKNSEVLINNSTSADQQIWVKLNQTEKDLIKPLYSGNSIHKYHTDETDKYLIWLNKANYSPELHKKIPNIISHLEIFKALLINRNTIDTITIEQFEKTKDKGKLYNGDGDTQATLGKGNYYLLQKYAYGLNFGSPKIMWQSRGDANFYFSKDEHYALSSVNFIYCPDDLKNLPKNIPINEFLSYLSGVLNSEFYQEFYQGNNNNTGTKIKSLEILKLDRDNKSDMSLVKQISQEVENARTNGLKEQPQKINDLVKNLYGLN